MANAPPISLTIRSYQVGFGDCFLLSFNYKAGGPRHVLVDFGSTGLPDHLSSGWLRTIAEDIARRAGATKSKDGALSGGKLHAVVATHRHKDHIAGFATAANGKGPGDLIRDLAPDLVVQPWTEDPDLGTQATGPKGATKAAKGRVKQVAALSAMQAVAGHTLMEARRGSGLPRALRAQLAFLGEDNLSNLSAVKNLMAMGRRKGAAARYVFHGSKSGLEAVLPGVKVHVLGPPTVEQTDTIKTMRAKDRDEFWHLQAKAFGRGGADGGRNADPLFPRFVQRRSGRFPVDARWLIYHARAMRGQQLLQIVRMLDDQMNNTSVILVFEIGKTKLLFPGDAQIENWQYALAQKASAALLADVNVYKVGHHGSLNATPKSLWKLFKNRSDKKDAPHRLISLLSTMHGKHGDEASKTEVPRRTLLDALERDSQLFNTEKLQGRALCHETVLEL